MMELNHVIVKVAVVVSDSGAPNRLCAIFSLSDGRTTYNGAASVVTALTRGAIGGSGGMTSPGLLDMYLLFNGVDTTHESTQTETGCLRELFAIPSLMTFDIRVGDMQYNTRPMSMNCIGAVSVIICRSNNNGNDSGNVNTTNGKSMSDGDMSIYISRIKF